MAGGNRCLRCWRWVSEPDSSGPQSAAICGRAPDIRGLQTDCGGNLPLYCEIHLVAIRRTEIQLIPETAAGNMNFGRPACSGRGTATYHPVIAHRIGQSGRIIELLPDREGLVVGE